MDLDPRRRRHEEAHRPSGLGSAWRTYPQTQLNIRGSNEPTTKNRSSWRILIKQVIERRNYENNSCVWPISFNPESMVTFSTTNIQNAFLFTAWRFLGRSHRERRKKGQIEMTLLNVYGVSLSLSGLNCSVFQNIVTAAIKAVIFLLNCSVKNNQRCS